VLTLGIVLTITAIIMLLSLSSAETLAEGKLNAQGLGLALIAFWTTFFSYLVGGLQALLLLGVVAIVAGWFAGRSSYAGILRDQVCDGLHELGEVIPVGLNTFVRSYSLFLRWAVALVLVFILTAFGNMSVVRVFWLVALGVLFFAAIEACNRPDRELYAEASLNEVTI